jgi:hypothetical protein
MIPMLVEFAKYLALLDRVLPGIAAEEYNFFKFPSILFPNTAFSLPFNERDQVPNQ